MDILSSPSHAPAQRGEDATDADALRRRITDKLRHHIGHAPGPTSERDWFVATALAVRDAVVGPWLDSTQRAADAGAKRVYYLSLEFLPGRMLLDASLFGDIALIEAATLVALVVATLTQLISDIGYILLNPQIRLK